MEDDAASFADSPLGQIIGLAEHGHQQYPSK